MKSKLKKRKSNYPTVIIDWWDHTGDASWFDKESIKDTSAVKCRTIGYLVEETELVYKIADTLTDDQGYGGLAIILKSCVTDYWELEF
jgi:uncharacterized protein (DUF924 family)|tara:strand:+ start:402 stop:665 length:264 start_codon:yes stop_codon:yes gene_type:complete